MTDTFKSRLNLAGRNHKSAWKTLILTKLSWPELLAFLREFEIMCVRLRLEMSRTVVFQSVVWYLVCSKLFLLRASLLVLRAFSCASNCVLNVENHHLWFIYHSMQNLILYLMIYKSYRVGDDFQHSIRNLMRNRMRAISAMKHGTEKVWFVVSRPLSCPWSWLLFKIFIFQSVVRFVVLSLGGILKMGSKKILK